MAGESHQAVDKLAEESNHVNRDVDEEPTKEDQQPLYFSKDGRLLFGDTPPTAFAVSYPYPPLPSNLVKNRVLRVVDDQCIQEEIAEATKEFEKEAYQLRGLATEGAPLSKMLIPEIELALYWDRHPYEFRLPPKGQEQLKQENSQNSDAAMRRTKSEMNLSSKVGKVLEEQSIRGNSRRSSVSASSNKTSRSSTVTTALSVKHLANESGNELPSPKNSHYGEHLAGLPNKNSAHQPRAENRCVNGKCGSSENSRKGSASNTSVRSRSSGDSNKSKNKPGSVDNQSSSSNANQVLGMSESERKKFQDIKLFHNQTNDKQCQGQGPNSRPKLVRSKDQIDSLDKKSAGVQVTIEDVTAAALKSTYLCPLHGQYKKGIQRRDKGGFRTDMGFGADNVHAHCSRALRGKQSKTKMIKTTETQTEGSEIGIHVDNKTNQRSKTAGHGRQKGKDVMASEYHGSFRDPYRIAESEKRHLRNKILNYCFTKHSIF